MARGSQPGERRGGRQKGTPNRATAAQRDAIAASGLTPLAFLMKVYRGSKYDIDLRTEAARAAAPYVHPRLSSVEMTGVDGGPLSVSIRRYARD